VLPVYVPLAIRALEPPGPRQRIMTGFVLLGGVVSALLLIAMVRGPVTAELGSYHLSYHTSEHAGLLISTAYVGATCGSMLFSGYHRIAVFGIVNLVAVAILARLTIDGFASLWCGWAALTSCAIALQLRFTSAHRSVADVLA
jgi:hypothetical protein